jgi:hypothetical protein
MANEFKSNLINLADSLQAVVIGVVVKDGKVAVENIKQRMRSGKSGRIYNGHQASAPGESPAVDSGALINSLDVIQVSNSDVAVYSSDPKAPLLEYGTSKMAARPFLSAESYAMEKRLPQNVESGIKELAEKYKVQ